MNHHSVHHDHRRRGGALALAIALLLASTQVASAATLSRSWQAKIVAGTATISAYTNGTGALALKLTGLKASTSYATIIYRGTCSTVGAKLLTLVSFATTSAGAATKSIALTSSHVGSITSATSGGNTIAIRVGAGTLTKCGLFTVQPVVAARVSLGNQAFGLAADGTSVWTVNWDDATVSRINPATNIVTATIAVGRHPDSIASDGTSVWVTNQGDNTVSRIDPATNTVTATVPVGTGPLGVAIGGGAVWVANNAASSVSRIDPATNAVTATVLVGVGPAVVAFGEGAVWVTNWDDGTVSRIDPTSNTVVATIPVGAVDSVVAGGGSVWVSVWGFPVFANGSVARIEPATNTVTSQVTVGYNPVGMAIVGDTLYVALAGDPTIVQVRGGAVTARIAVGMKSYRLAPGNGSLWVLHPVGSGIAGAGLYAGGVTRLNI
ncbi:MAG: 40-residue family beta-propeller repeat-containing protein [Chloroflexi bacterium]|nr:40-residue family beta-propeller repeat-containing protein [Chloroflexota bacterium]